MKPTILALLGISLGVTLFFTGYKFGLQNGVEASHNIRTMQTDQFINFANNSASKGNEMGATLFHGVALGTQATSQSIYGAWSYFKTIKRVDLAEIVAQTFKPSSEEEASQLAKLMKLEK